MGESYLQLNRHSIPAAEIAINWNLDGSRGLSSDHQVALVFLNVSRINHLRAEAIAIGLPEPPGKSVHVVTVGLHRVGAFPYPTQVVLVLVYKDFFLRFREEMSDFRRKSCFYEAATTIYGPFASNTTINAAILLACHLFSHGR
jgi:hypothetical protein